MIKPGEFIPSFDSRIDSDKDLSIQFQILEDLQMQLPVKVSTNEIRSERQSVASNSSGNPDDLSQNNTEEIQSANTDSILATEMRKTIEEIKEDLPEDSIPKVEEIQHQEIKKTEQNFAENIRKYNENKKFYYENYRMIYNLKAIYPYVMKVKEVVDNLNAQLVKMNNNQEKHKLIKQTEKQLFGQFEKDVRKLSYTQGKLMLKLISRETNETTYGLIKNYKGGLTASFWYTVGLVFQEDLKAKYDSIGEDKKLETVVKKFKKGDL